MNDELTYNQKMNLINLAISRIKDARDEWQRSEANPASTFGERALHKDIFERTEQEFAWQWKNVADILSTRNAT